MCQAVVMPSCCQQKFGCFHKPHTARGLLRQDAGLDLGWCESLTLTCLASLQCRLDEEIRISFVGSQCVFVIRVLDWRG